MRVQDLNLRPWDYETHELPTAPTRKFCQGDRDRTCIREVVHNTSVPLPFSHSLSVRPLPDEIHYKKQVPLNFYLLYAILYGKFKAILFAFANFFKNIFCLFIASSESGRDLYAASLLSSPSAAQISELLLWTACCAAPSKA